MFFRTSRYFKLSELFTDDARGRMANGKVLRRLPTVSGRFQHIVDGSDRLDNLAYKYYKKPSQWWRFCDANPAFMSPRALIGKDARMSIAISIAWEGAQPPWYEMRNRLIDEPGIEKVRLGNSDDNMPEQQMIDGSFMFAISATLSADIESTLLTQQLAPALDTALQGGGLIMNTAIRMQAVENNQWLLTDQQSAATYHLYLQGSDINVFEAIPLYSWLLRVEYNRQNIDLETIIQIVEQLHEPGFILTLPTEIRRVGKPIVIPPLVTSEAS